MSTDFDSEPNYDALFDALVEKTKAGKLDWQETAEEGTFIAAVKGVKTFRVELGDIGIDDVLLEVLDKDGSHLIRTTSRSPVAIELYSLARRIALRLDEKIDATMKLLHSL